MFQIQVQYWFGFKYIFYAALVLQFLNSPQNEMENAYWILGDQPCVLSIPSRKVSRH